MGEYDTALKSLAKNSPEAMARFVLREWQKQKGADAPAMEVQTVTLLSEEFQSEELKGDGVWLVEDANGPVCLVEIEYQSRLDPYMPLRSLEYLARAKKMHWKQCGHLPVIAVVIYLFDDKNMPDCPLHWPAPYEQTAMVFHYLIIKLKDFPREELLALQEPALWPLVLLTKGKVDRILIAEMFADLLEQKLYNVLPIGHTIAAWFLRGADLDWLSKEYRQMYDFFKDSPALQWMEADARADEQRKADQRVLEIQKKAIAAFRETVIALVSQRFPKLKRLVKAQVRVFNEPDLFPDLILRLSLARDAEETQDILLNLHEAESAENVSGIE